MAMSVLPVPAAVDSPITVNSTITLKSNFILDTVEARLYTPFPDNGLSTIGLYHLEGNLSNSAKGSAATSSSVSYIETNALFGKQSIERGSFTAAIGTLSGDFTLELWINISATSDETALFSGSNFIFGIGPDHRLFFSSEGNMLEKSSIPVDVNLWTHVALVRKGQNLRFLINGRSVSNAVVFTGQIIGTLTVACPGNGMLDEVRFSNISQLLPDTTVLRSDIPTLHNMYWLRNGQKTVNSFIPLTPGMWNNGNIKFQLVSEAAGRFILNLQTNGGELPQWSKNGNPIMLTSDQIGPYVKSAIFIPGPDGARHDTLEVAFSEYIHCDSLKKNISPAASFNVYGPDDTLKENLFEGSYFIDAGSCQRTYRTSVTIIMTTGIDQAITGEDSILLTGSAVDTSGNYPEPKRGPIACVPKTGVADGFSNEASAQGNPVTVDGTPGAGAVHIVIPSRAGASTPVTVQAFDSKGRLLADLFSKELQPGNHTINLYGVNKLPPNSLAVVRVDVRGHFTKTLKVISVR